MPGEGSAYFDWSTFLDLAERLAESSDEASLRSAISRGYYALFHRARRYAVRHQFQPPGPPISTHQALIAWFKQRPSDEEREIGDELDDLRKLRNDADYQVRSDFVPQFVKATLILCRRYLQQVDQLS